MPELPEVETLRRDLDREVAGRRIASVQAHAGRSLRRHPDPEAFVQALVGATVTGVARTGKYLVLPLEADRVTDRVADRVTDRVADGVAGERPDLVVHLGMSGQLLLSAADAPTVRHTHVVIGFDDGRELRFVDPRTFGEMFVSGAGQPELSHLGADALRDVTTSAQLARLLGARRARLKSLLMDQRFLAGLGNIYTDEILFAARLRYDRGSDTLTGTEVRRLHRAMADTLQAAIAARGSSLADAQYRDAFGRVGDFQLQHRVYAREGQACVRCRQPIVRVKTGGRSTFFCPHCQA